MQCEGERGNQEEKQWYSAHGGLRELEGELDTPCHPLSLRNNGFELFKCSTSGLFSSQRDRYCSDNSLCPLGLMDITVSAGLIWPFTSPSTPVPSRSMISLAKWESDGFGHSFIIGLNTFSVILLAKKKILHFILTCFYIVFGKYIVNKKYKNIENTEKINDL